MTPALHIGLWPSPASMGTPPVSNLPGADSKHLFPLKNPYAHPSVTFAGVRPPHPPQATTLLRLVSLHVGWNGTYSTKPDARAWAEDFRERYASARCQKWIAPPPLPVHPESH